MPKDFRIKIGFLRHHKTRKLKRRLGSEGVLALISLWEYAAEFRPAGSLNGLSDEDVDLAACWEGPSPLAPVLLEIGFLDGGPGSYELHDWAQHNPWVAESDERSAKGLFSRLAQVNPDAHRLLLSQGVTAITKAQYLSYKDGPPPSPPPSPPGSSRAHPGDTPGSGRGSAGVTPGSPQGLPGVAPAPAPAPSPSLLMHREKEYKLSASGDAARGGEGVSGVKEKPPEYVTRKGRRLKGPDLENFHRFWEAFDWKKGKAEAADAWLEIPNHSKPLAEKIISAAAAEASGRPQLLQTGKSPKWAQGWLAARRWEDEDFGSSSVPRWKRELDRWRRDRHAEEPPCTSNPSIH